MLLICLNRDQRHARNIALQRLLPRQVQAPCTEGWPLVHEICLQSTTQPARLLFQMYLLKHEHTSIVMGAMALVILPQLI